MAIEKVTDVWNRARIPTCWKAHAINKLELLYKQWTTLKKHRHRIRPTGCARKWLLLENVKFVRYCSCRCTNNYPHTGYRSWLSSCAKRTRTTWLHGTSWQRTNWKGRAKEPEVWSRAKTLGYSRSLQHSQDLKEMLPEGVLSIAIRADFWQPQKNERKTEFIKYWHQRAVLDRRIDIKRVAYNHVTAILQQCQTGQKCVVLLLHRHTFYFCAISQELLQVEI